jgi:hypothetical protein
VAPAKKDASQDDVDALFAEAEASKMSDEDFDFEDLLDQVVEDDSEGWVPTEPGEGISGVIVAIGTQRSDFAKAGEDPNCPTWTLQTKDGSKFRVIGFGTVLRREMEDSGASVGDRAAVKYFGKRVNKSGAFKGKESKIFGLVVRPAVR